MDGVEGNDMEEKKTGDKDEKMIVTRSSVVK
jgi:hypothetical protein